MSVAESMGFTARGPEPVSAQKWREWCRTHPGLARFENTADLRGWVRSAPADESGDVLWCLAQLAAQDGGDDVEAARLLAWLLLGEPLGGMFLLGAALVFAGVWLVTTSPSRHSSSGQSAGASWQYDGWHHNGISFVHSGSMVLLTAIAA